MHVLLLSITLALLWIVLSGLFTPLMLAFGAFSVALVVLIVHRMDVVDHEGLPLHLHPFRLLSFWWWLLGQIVKSSFAVTRIILSPRLSISPSMTTVDISRLSIVSQATYANSVTLTPGSLTVELGPDGKALIHTLKSETAAELAENGLVDRLAAVETGWTPGQNGTDKKAADQNATVHNREDDA